MLLQQPLWVMQFLSLWAKPSLSNMVTKQKATRWVNHHNTYGHRQSDNYITQLISVFFSLFCRSWWLWVSVIHLEVFSSVFQFVLLCLAVSYRKAQEARHRQDKCICTYLRKHAFIHVCSSHCVCLDGRSSVWCNSTGDSTKVRLTFSGAAQGMYKQSSVQTMSQITKLFLLNIDSLYWHEL